MRKNRRVSLIILLVIAAMSGVAILFEDDLTTRFGIAALVIAYAGVTFNTISNEDQAEVRQRHHDELIATLKEIGKR